MPCRPAFDNDSMEEVRVSFKGISRRSAVVLDKRKRRNGVNEARKVRENRERERVEGRKR